MSKDALAKLESLRAHVTAHGQPDWEVVLSQAYAKFLRPGNVVFDIGAHSGKHTRNFINLVGAAGRVIAFEPLPHLAAFTRSIYSQFPSFELREKALSDGTASSVDFVVCENYPEESGLRERIFNAPDAVTRKITVATSTIDAEAVNMNRLDFIKIDIEGAEILCLKGSIETIKKFRPVISIEFGFPSYSVYDVKHSDLYDFMSDQDYVISDLFGNLITSADDWSLICDQVYWDYFAVPSERASNWSSQVRAGQVHPSREG